MGSMLILIIWDSVPEVFVTGWILLLALSIISRLLLMSNYKKAQIGTLTRWKAYFISASFFSGIIWGMSGLLIEIYALDAHQGIEVFILGGMAAGSITTSTPIRWNYPAFMIPTLSMLGIYLVVQNDNSHQLMAVMLILFIIILSVMSINFRRLQFDQQVLLLLSSRSIERLHASEEHMKEITSSMAEGVFVLDAEGAASYLNPTALEMLGYTEKELLGKRLHTFIHEHIDVQRCPIEKAVKDHKRSWVSEDIFKRKDQRKINVRYSVAPIKVDDKDSGVVCVFSDITNERRVQRVLEREHLLHIAGPVIVFDWLAEENWPVVYVSSNITRWGYTPEELMQGEIIFSSLVYEDDLARVTDEVTRYTNSGVDDFEQYYRIKTREGEVIWIYDYTAIQRDKEGVVTHYYGYLLDITELKNAEIVAREHAQQDPLTGIYNRQKFDDAFEMEFTRMKRYSLPLSLIMFDIDHFKQVNDTYGHLVGDGVLREITALVKKDLRSVDTFARWGGEEFMILLPETTIADALRLAEKIRRKISEYDFSGVGHISSSFGVVDAAIYDDTDICLERVDYLLYKAKENGRDRVES